MKKFILFFVITGTFVFDSSCKKKKTEPVNPSVPLEFVSLSANPTVVEAGQTSSLTATANGENISYQWNMAHGNLFGSGSSVLFGAQACCVGINTITCTITDGRTTLKKTVDVEVTQGGH